MTAGTAISVNAIDVYSTTSNSLDLPIGARLIIGHAQTAFSRTAVPGQLLGLAFGLEVIGVGGNLSAKSGPWALARLVCTGGSSTVSVASVSVPGIITSGTIQDQVAGQIGISASTSSAQSSVQSVSALSGLITADAITTDATATVTSSGSVSGSTTLVNAVIAGNAISAHPGRNTRINIAGLGYVILNEQSSSTTATSARINVIAIDVHVTTSNAFGLPVGARIIIARSEAGVQLFGWEAQL